MVKEKIELTLQDESGQEYIAYPFVESEDVTLSNGMDIETMIAQDVSMPIVTHEETSFKVGVGDSDISNSIVDSSVANMTIKGQTYQNILPEPSTHVLSNNKEMFKVNEGLDPNVEIVDGVSKSAILSGQTLVNIFPTKSATYSSSTTGQIRIFASTKLAKPIPVNGKAIFLYDNIFPYDSQSGFIQLYKTNENNLPAWIGASNFMKKSNGKNYIIISNTYDSEITHIDFYVSNGVEGNYALDNMMVIEYQQGMENWDIPYFEGMQSVKMPVLTTIGKNLFNYFDLVAGKIIWDTSNNVNIFEDGWYQESVDGVGFALRKCIKVKPNTRYYTNFPQSMHFMQYKANGDLIKGNYPTTSTGYVTTSSETHYVNLFPSGGISSAWNEARRQEYQNCYISESEVMSSYEPYKSNILHTPEEVVLRSLPNGVKDTLNLNTGEYVQRIGEIVLDGSENWVVDSNVFNNTYRFALTISNMIRKDWHDIITQEQFVKSNVFKSLDLRVEAHNLDTEHLTGWDVSRMILNINKAKLSENSVNALKTYLQQNPITVQYQLATESIKTVDLSSSGNWEKVVLDGSESWRTDGQTDYNFKAQTVLPYTRQMFTNHKNFKNWTEYNSANGYEISCHGGNIGTAPNYTGSYFNLSIPKNIITSTADLKTHLSRNPITVWYQTTTHQDSTQVKQPIFFKEGHIIQSSGVDNSLIPTLDYQAKTSNSYVMDLMKPNTRYTMKAKSASGTFTIDGTSYGAGTNGTFTTPTSMTNKLLVMSDTAHEEVMILEGAVTDKTIPYFKGIKSAFEDEDKIEVLSTGKNLIDETLWTKSIIEDGVECLYGDGWYSSSGSAGTPILIPVDIKQGKRYRISVTHKATTHFNNYKILQDCLNNRIVGDTQSVCILDRLNTFTESNTSFVANFDAKYLMVDTGNPRCYGYIKKGTLIIEEIERDGVITAYEPYKSNSTKIPLLSSLRSLPNGVRDEVILDRENHKAKIIQRVGEIVLDGNNNIGTGGKTIASYFEGLVYLPSAKLKTPNGSYAFCDKVMTSNTHDSAINYVRTNTESSQYLILGVCGEHLTTVDVKGVQDYLKKNLITVYYELATPITTEIDLEGFPYIYKDGHIFLNGEIAPVTEIKYSINQSHMIEASNQDLIRQEKKLTNLQRLIGEYVRVDYNSTLLSLELELK